MEDLVTLGLRLPGIPPPPPQGLELLMEDLVALGLRLPRILPPPPPGIGTCHGGLSNFGSEAAKNTPLPLVLELLMEDLVTLVMLVMATGPTMQGIGSVKIFIKEICLLEICSLQEYVH